MSVLPGEILVRIALFIPSSSDVFSYVDALRSHCDLGPLELLYEWGNHYGMSDLWPSLTITAAFLDRERHRDVKSLVQMYSTVFVYSLVESEDLKWLREHVDPMAEQEWVLMMYFSQPGSTEFWNTFVNFQIVKLTLKGVTTDMANYLAKFQFLRSLELAGHNLNEESILEFAAASARLTELKLHTSTFVQPTDSMLRNAIAWFRRQPVQSFSCWLWRWGVNDIELKKEFLES
ncbi:hypothetical protein LEN26_012361 [Aphanomyces euteiches]|nr:hypothetical protein LEN26_012361 [Aphanomyces euteiches]